MTSDTFVSQVRVRAKEFFASRKELKSLLEQDKTGISASLPDGPIGPVDPVSGKNVGYNADITKADFLAALKALGDLETYLIDPATGAPNATNLALQKLL
jgi:hypothetical protein